jgi:hypothetical protein
MMRISYPVWTDIGVTTKTLCRRLPRSLKSNFSPSEYLVACFLVYFCCPCAGSAVIRPDQNAILPARLRSGQLSMWLDSSAMRWLGHTIEYVVF